MLTTINAKRASDDAGFFRNTIVDNCKLVLFLEFLVGLYAFGLVTELVMCPILAFFGILRAFADAEERYERVARVLGTLAALFGFFVLFYSVRSLVQDLPGFFTFENLRAFLLAPILSIAFLPFVFLFALYMTYESIFVRVKIFNGDGDLARYTKRRILRHFHFNLPALSRWSKTVGSLEVGSEADVSELLVRQAREA